MVPVDTNKPIFLKILGDKHLLSNIIALLADMRHILNEGTEKTITVTFNKNHGSNPILFSVDDQEIDDYKPRTSHYEIN